MSGAPELCSGRWTQVESARMCRVEKAGRTMVRGARSKAWSGRRATIEEGDNISGDRPPLGVIPVGRMPKRCPSAPGMSPKSTRLARGNIMPRSRPNPHRGGLGPALPPELRQVNLNAAGIDVGAESHYVAVPAGRDPEGRDVRQFGAFTGDL